MPASSVACFGKLPFHREFLRLGLGSPAATWMVRWIEGAHATLTEAGAAGNPDRIVRIVVPGDDGRAATAGVVRQSSDGLRKHPVALWVELPQGFADGVVHLLPLACGALWVALEGLLTAPGDDLTEFTRAVTAGVGIESEAPIDYASWCALGAEGDPWSRLTGLTGDAVRHLALNFHAVARSQRSAAVVEEGVALVVPLAAAPPDTAALAAAVLLEAFAAAVPGATPSVIALAPSPDQLYAVYRPTDGSDLAAMLGGPMGGLDDLADGWQKLPPEDAALAARLATVGAAAAGAPAEVVGWVREVMEP